MVRLEFIYIELEIEMASRPRKKPEANKGIPVSTRPTIPWQQTPGMYLAGKEWVDEVDLLQIELEKKWGRDRLRLLVNIELREKFDRQRYLYKQALWEGQLEDVKREAERMMTALRTLDKRATAANQKPIDPTVWEVRLENGTVAAIVKEPDATDRVINDGRYVIVYTLEEIGKLISADSFLLTAKEIFPGAEVVKVNMKINDPFNAMAGIDNDGIFDISAPIDDVLGFEDLNDEIPF